MFAQEVGSEFSEHLRTLNRDTVPGEQGLLIREASLVEQEQRSSFNDGYFHLVQQTISRQRFDEAPTFGALSEQRFDEIVPYAPSFDGLAATSFLVDERAPTFEGLTAGHVTTTASTDVAGTIQSSPVVQTVSIQRRSPVAMDPHIRGYNVGQIYTQADGAYWFPVRDDLDTMLSKIDQSLISDVIVIPGPYGVRFGPGFAFFDVVTVDAPRYMNGYESHARVGLNYRANSHGIHGLTTLYGGSADYGYVFSYSNRTGDDYDVGGNGPISRVPSSYHNQNFWGQFGFDCSPNSRIEVRYQRLDQVDTEYAAQIFDVRYLVTDGFNIAWVHEDPTQPRRTTAEAWYNRTRFEGDTERSNKRSAEFPVISRIDAALRVAVSGSPSSATLSGVTDGDLRSTGARTVTKWGEHGSAQLSLGADLRFLEQHIHERYDLHEFYNDPNFLNPKSLIETNLPRAQMIDPGMFAEFTAPVTSFWTANLGGRVDWVHTTAEDEGGMPYGIRTVPPTSLPGAPANRDQDDVLFAAYLSNELEYSSNWTTKFGVGHAQRVPTLMERYADGVFLGIIQNGFSRVIGNPNLNKERAWQADVTVRADYDIWRSRVSGFYSWIDDYVTFTANEIEDPTGARLLQAINTTHATLSGVEWYGELDLTAVATAFGSVRYVDGRDQAIEQPLPQIAPLEGRSGLRFEEAADNPRWGGELGTRLVDRQHREALFRPTGSGNLIAVEQETPGFTTVYIRGFWNVTDEFHIVGGVENLFDRTYVEHLDLRLPAQTAPLPEFSSTVVYSPGVTPYLGIEWER